MKLKWKFATNATRFTPANKKLSTRQVELKNSTKNIQNSNEEIANAYDHLTPPDYPIAYKARKWFFCGLPFYVNEHVLVPRADTEILVQEVVKHCPENASVLDLCTGSGCIAIALYAKGFTDITASDISEETLKVARLNAKTNKAKIKFIQSNLFENIKTKFDIIASNPPYIKTNEIGIHDKSILHEPRHALDGGVDGLGFYRRIIAEVPKHLDDNGKIFFEIGDKQQAEEVKTLLHENKFCDIQIIKDRVIHARKIN